MLFKKGFFVLFILLVNLAACSKKVVPPQANLKVETPETNSKIVSNIHFVFGTVTESSGDSLSIQTDDLSVISFDVEDSIAGNVATHELNDTVKVYYREVTHSNGVVEQDLIRLEVVQGEPKADLAEVNQSINGVVISASLETVVLQLTKDQSVTVDLKSYADVAELPKINVGDVVKVVVSGAIDLGTASSIEPIKIEVIKSSLIQV